ncbi:MAG: hypothetical protein BJ554DRAFT_4980 [Olpidium bornovanus]|uniref:Uncharacterized protein n=1 Tax=Olpidium bornovanus TaxID=278681 RepID=A0A8H7ZM37_9FUNG|nr:MAG: hypothetical protein BJ554DRAFT_4980 [Olpidium bornovanus]
MPRALTCVGNFDGHVRTPTKNRQTNSALSNLTFGRTATIPIRHSHLLVLGDQALLLAEVRAVLSAARCVSWRGQGKQAAKEPDFFRATLTARSPDLRHFVSSSMRRPLNLELFAAACSGGQPARRAGCLKTRLPLLLRTSSSAAGPRPASPLLAHAPPVLDLEPDVPIAARSRNVASRQALPSGRASFHAAAALFKLPEHFARPSQSRLIGQPTPQMHPHLMHEGEGAQFASETAFANLTCVSVYRTLTTTCRVGG